MSTFMICKFNLKCTFRHPLNSNSTPTHAEVYSCAIYITTGVQHLSMYTHWNNTIWKEHLGFCSETHLPLHIIGNLLCNVQNDHPHEIGSYFYQVRNVNDNQQCNAQPHICHGYFYNEMFGLSFCWYLLLYQFTYLYMTYQTHLVILSQTLPLGLSSAFAKWLNITGI